MKDSIQNNPRTRKQISFQTIYLINNKIYSDEIEELDEKSLVLHLRNAISHNKAHVYPYSIDDEDGDRDIKGFEFMDKKGKYKFKLKLTLDEIRILATGLCRLMLGEYECFE